MGFNNLLTIAVPKPLVASTSDSVDFYMDKIET